MNLMMPLPMQKRRYAFPFPRLGGINMPLKFFADDWSIQTDFWVPKVVSEAMCVEMVVGARASTQNGR